MMDKSTETAEPSLWETMNSRLTAVVLPGTELDLSYVGVSGEA